MPKPTPKSAANLPLVSINVVTYKQAGFIAATLDSILAQDYPNLEIIVADDASPDATASIAKAYAAKHKNIKLLLQPVNRGHGVNASAGMAACTGEFICPFAGDDLMLPGKISRQVAYMRANPECVLCHHNMEWFDSDTGKALRLHHQPGSQAPVASQLELFAGNPIGGPAVMVRRAAVPKSGYSLRFLHVGDWLMWIETLNKGGTIGYLDEVLVRYRRHEGNATRVNPHIGQEQLAFVNYLRATYPQAPHAALRHALSLAWNASAVGAFSTNRPAAALYALAQTLRYGRLTRKVVAGFAFALIALPLPNAWRQRLWGVYANRRFQ